MNTVSVDRLYDLKQLEEIAFGNQDFIISLGQIFLQTIPDNSTELLTAAKAANWDMTFKLAHKLKSTIDTMNIHSLKNDIRVLEVDAKGKKNLETLPAIAEKVNCIIHIVAEQLKDDLSL